MSTATLAPVPTTPDYRARVFRIHRWMRLVLWLHAVVIDCARLGYASVPALIPVILTFMLAWTLLASWCYRSAARRRWFVFAADGVVTLLIMLVSPLLLPSFPFGGVGQSLTGYWMAGFPLAVAIWRGWAWGGLTGLLVSVTSFCLHPRPQPEAWGAVMLVPLAGVGLGYLVSQMITTLHERDAYFQQAAAMGERERLNRIVHDGVLQVLAMVERDGSVLGSRGQMLARLAKEQEIKLRALLQSKDVDIAGGERVDEAETNLLTLLDQHESRTVTISAMADDVMVATERAREIDAIVAELLRNVDKHAGPDAHAWVLVERDEDQLTVTVRDNGVGAKPQDVLAAFRHGRLGVRESVLGRVRDLGGETDLRAAVGRGVEWEFRIPVEAPEHARHG